MKALQELYRDNEIISCGGPQNIAIRGLHYDSRSVDDGFLFVCIPGLKTDGHLYIEHAVKNGACAVIIAKDIPVPAGVSWVKVRRSREALALASARFYNHPSENIRLVGVTGTNGKTTTVHLIEAIARESGFSTGYLSTIDNKIGQTFQPAERTTPESVDVQHFLSKMVETGVDYVVMEVSSHALALDRVKGCQFDTAVFTNISQDHLDFHKDLKEYAQAKAKLFENLQDDNKQRRATAVINLDDSWGEYFQKKCSVPVLTYGIKEDADIRASSINMNYQGVCFQINYPGGSANVSLRLSGLFSVYNCLAAFAAALGEEISPQVAVRALEKVEGVRGRFQVVAEGQQFGVVVDYAHTPDGLWNVLNAARKMSRNKVITVFGCGGDRDKEKRPLMGKVAASLSDFCIITSDNPRTEESGEIINQIIAGVQEVTTAKYRVIEDRKKAIKEAISQAEKGDLVMICGKGHETYQEIKGKKYFFDDTQVARLFIKERL